MKRLLTLSVLLALFTSSCSLIEQQFKDKLTHSWKFTRMNNADMDITDDNSQLIHTIYKQFKYGYLRLYDDHKYTFVGEEISAMHSWYIHKSDSTLILDSFAHNTELRFRILRNEHEWLKLSLTGYGKTAIDGHDYAFLFSNVPNFEYSNIDLLSYPINAWRIRPTHKENQDEILKRVKGNVDYSIAYYKMIEDDNRSSFMPMYLQTVFKFYQNGMSVVSEENMKEGWESCFYDHQDAEKGRKMLADAIQSMGQYPDAKNFTEGYLKALKQMREFLDKIN
jgi:hypothetical protein